MYAHPNPVRDQRADRRYFEELIRANREAVEVGRSDAADDEGLRDEDPDLYAHLLHIYRTAAFTVTNASYSIGDPLSTITEYAVELIRAETIFRRYESLLPDGATFASHPADYVGPLQVLSLARLLEIDSGVDELIAATGSQGMDSIYDFLARPDRVESRVGSSVVWPKPYASLLEYLRDPASPGPMQQFLNHWYNQNRRGITWGSHLTIAEGDRRYSGYWCFEAAAVVKLLQADDSSYRDNAYYPGELLMRE